MRPAGLDPVTAAELWKLPTERTERIERGESE
jgi:hypothetical protein